MTSRTSMTWSGIGRQPRKYPRTGAFANLANLDDLVPGLIEGSDGGIGGQSPSKRHEIGSLARDPSGGEVIEVLAPPKPPLFRSLPVGTHGEPQVLRGYRGHQHRGPK